MLKVKKIVKNEIPQSLGTSDLRSKKKAVEMTRTLYEYLLVDNKKSEDDVAFNRQIISL